MCKGKGLKNKIWIYLISLFKWYITDWVQFDILIVIRFGEQ